jgi:hypothetical protein
VLFEHGKTFFVDLNLANTGVPALFEAEIKSTDAKRQQTEKQKLTAY